MALRGRKRKSGRERYRNGRIRQDQKIDRESVARSMPHRRGLPQDIRAAEFGETGLGRLFLGGKISAEQREAGAKYADIVASFAALITAPRLGMEGDRRQVGRGEISDEQDNAIRAAYHSAFNALSRKSRQILMAVNDVCVHHREPRHWDQLVAGLETLVEHFGLRSKGLIPLHRIKARSGPPH